MAHRIGLKFAVAIILFSTTACSDFVSPSSPHAAGQDAPKTIPPGDAKAVADDSASPKSVLSIETDAFKDERARNYHRYYKVSTQKFEDGCKTLESPDLKYVASCFTKAYKNIVQIYEPVSGQFLDAFPRPGPEDGNMFLEVGNRFLIHDPATGVVDRYSFPRPRRLASVATLEANEKIDAIACPDLSRSVLLTHVKSGKRKTYKVRDLSKNGEVVASQAFENSMATPHFWRRGTRVVFIDYEEVRLWDVEKNTFIGEGWKTGVWQMGVGGRLGRATTECVPSPNEEVIAFARDDGTVLVVDLADGRVRYQFQEPGYAKLKPKADSSTYWKIKLQFAADGVGLMIETELYRSSPSQMGYDNPLNPIPPRMIGGEQHVAPKQFSYWHLGPRASRVDWVQENILALGAYRYTADRRHAVYVLFLRGEAFVFPVVERVRPSNP